ncbi:MAG: hypothetical protein NTZ68_00945 [Candidatus Dependentiae bacterium]|nr:hypothetical protein [Candidatus Dependentiae bacterium]
MKYIAYGMLCMVTFQIAHSSQDDTFSSMQNNGKTEHAGQSSFHRQDSLGLSEQSDGISSHRSLRHNSATLNYASGDTHSLERHSTFYLLDREISDLNRKMSRSKIADERNDDGFFAEDEGLSAEFAILCEKVRSFQSEKKNDETLIESLDDTLVGALFAVACLQGLPFDIIPTSISCSQHSSKSATDSTEALGSAAAKAESCQEDKNDAFLKGLVSVGSGVQVLVPLINFLTLESQSKEPKSKNFSNIPLVASLDESDSDFDSCDEREC